MKSKRYVIKGESRLVECAGCRHYEHHGNCSGFCGLSGRYIGDMTKKTLCNRYEKEERK